MYSASYNIKSKLNEIPGIRFLLKKIPYLANLYRVDFSLNLVTLNGTGDFNCPGCGNIISPDDDTGEVYRIHRSKIDKKRNKIKYIVVECQCETRTRLDFP